MQVDLLDTTRAGILLVEATNDAQDKNQLWESFSPKRLYGTGLDAKPQGLSEKAGLHARRQVQNSTGQRLDKLALPQQGQRLIVRLPSFRVITKSRPAEPQKPPHR